MIVYLNVFDCLFSDSLQLGILSSYGCAFICCWIERCYYLLLNGMMLPYLVDWTPAVVFCHKHLIASVLLVSSECHDKESSAPSTRNLVVDEDRMRLSHWLGVCFVLFSVIWHWQFGGRKEICCIKYLVSLIARGFPNSDVKTVFEQNW